MSLIKSASLLAALALTTSATPALAALKAGDKAPDFKLQTATDGKVSAFSLKDHLKKGPVVVYFYPKAFTGTCSLEARTFADNMPKFKAMNVTVLGVSTDTIQKVTEFSTADCQGKFPVAADTDAKVAKAYDTKMAAVNMAARVSYLITPDHKVAAVHEAGDGVSHPMKMLEAAQKLKK
ncbi:peroxiredoxin [Asticcacaulis machinosus]|uniref:Redoxin domain-containing protein n=1 Tax=Asticcacaulis machinosus TaxID=2984211 RepID=A0ABT5HF32_9CAUL|nr:redoxin domain-containing protein [Asticcacaulis machinosus]MDC7674603.1 redoxin domain-containing protein [Asticcacaulis machinosus]